MRELVINTNTFDSCMDTLRVVSISLKGKKEDSLARTLEHVINMLNHASVDLLIAQKRGIIEIRNSDQLEEGDD